MKKVSKLPPYIILFCPSNMNAIYQSLTLKKRIKIRIKNLPLIFKPTDIPIEFLNLSPNISGKNISA